MGSPSNIPSGKLSKLVKLVLFVAARSIGQGKNTFMGVIFDNRCLLFIRLNSKYFFGFIHTNQLGPNWIQLGPSISKSHDYSPNKTIVEEKIVSNKSHIHLYIKNIITDFIF